MTTTASGLRMPDASSSVRRGGWTPAEPVAHDHVRCRVDLSIDAAVLAVLRDGAGRESAAQDSWATGLTTQSGGLSPPVARSKAAPMVHRRTPPPTVVRVSSRAPRVACWLPDFDSGSLP